MDRANEPLCRSVVAERLARRLDAAAQVCLRDDPPLPDPFDDVVLGDGALPVLDQEDQKVEDLRLDRHKRVLAADLVRRWVDQICPDPIRHWPRSAGTPRRFGRLFSSQGSVSSPNILKKSRTSSGKIQAVFKLGGLLPVEDGPHLSSQANTQKLS